MVKVLVVEDDRAVRRIVTKGIESMGHVVIQSPNGKHAWETLSCNDDIELVITDMMMPEMDGRQLIQVIRGNSELARLPVIILSGVVDAKKIADLLQLGTTAFLPKPVKIVELQDCVKQCLEQAGI